MGGTRNPAILDEANLITLCRNCHRKLHEATWELFRKPEGIRVVETKTGRQIMRRLSNPGLDVPALLGLLNLAEDSLAQLLESLPYFTDDQLVEAFAYASSFGKRSWLVQAAILYEAQQRSIYGEHSLEAIASRFGIGLRQAEKYALVWKTFFARDGEEANGDGEENVNIDVFSLEEPSWYVVAATETKEPKKWLAYAQDRKAEDPRYSVASLRQDIQQTRQFNGPPRGLDAGQEGESNVRLPDLTRRACPWIRRLCVQSGKPVPVEACRDCEFEDDEDCQF